VPGNRLIVLETELDASLLHPIPANGRGRYVIRTILLFRSFTKLITARIVIELRPTTAEMWWRPSLRLPNRELLSIFSHSPARDLVPSRRARLPSQMSLLLLAASIIERSSSGRSGLGKDLRLACPSAGARGGTRRHHRRGRTDASASSLPSTAGRSMRQPVRQSGDDYQWTRSRSGI